MIGTHLHKDLNALTLHRIGHTDRRRFRHGRMRHERTFDLGGAYAVSGDVEHVIVAPSTAMYPSLSLVATSPSHSSPESFASRVHSVPDRPDVRSMWGTAASAPVGLQLRRRICRFRRAHRLQLRVRLRPLFRRIAIDAECRARAPSSVCHNCR